MRKESECESTCTHIFYYPYPFRFKLLKMWYNFKINLELVSHLDSHHSEYVKQTNKKKTLIKEPKCIIFILMVNLTLDSSGWPINWQTIQKQLSCGQSKCSERLCVMAVMTSLFLRVQVGGNRVLGAHLKATQTFPHKFADVCLETVQQCLQDFWFKLDIRKFS